MSDIGDLLRLMARLRDPQSGCPWDREQTFHSIAPYTLEEAYEVADAIEREAWDELPGELGDLLFQVVFHARLAEESGRFDFDDVVDGIVTKMTRRHPHVFAAAVVGSTAQQTQSWEAIKAAERPPRQGSPLAGVPLGLPALTRAHKLQRRAAREGLDWPALPTLFDQVRETLGKLEAELQQRDPTRLQDQLGELLFACVSLARHLEVDPEQALRRASDKFQRHFHALEQHLATDGLRLQTASPEELEQAWQQAEAEADSDQPA